MLAGALLGASGGSVGAHEVNRSTLELVLERGRIQGSLTANNVDLAGAIDFRDRQATYDPAWFEDHAPVLQEILEARVRFSAAGAQILPRLEKARHRIDERLEWETTATFTADLPADARELWLHCVLVPRIAGHQTFVVVRDAADEQRLVATVHARDPALRIELFDAGGDPAPTRAGAKGFFEAGVYHLLAGPDHLAFLLGLVLLGGTWRRLLAAVTCFTVAHTLTLGAAVAGFVRPPAAWVELTIGASIVWVGLSALTRRSDGKARPLGTFAFGLAHGFGFAGILAESLPADSIAAPLLAFNLGVEAGQVAIVLGLVAGATAARRFFPGRLRLIQRACAGSIALAGAWWTAERMSAFW